MKRLLGSIVSLYALLVLILGIWRGLVARKRASRAETRALEVWPFVSIIVPAWRDRSALENCLHTLTRVDYPDYDVIIVAGGPDGTCELAAAAADKDPRIRVVEQLPRGKNAALNQGLSLAGADIVVFLDADSELTPQWLKRLVGALRRGAAASTGNYLPLHETAVSLWGDLAKVNEYQVRDRVILQGSGGIAVSREALDVIGPFPEERVSSDWDLDARLAMHGYRRVFAADALIGSHRPATLTEWWRNELRWRRLHLRSLFRLKTGLLDDPATAARHLYPYLTSWTAGLLSVAAVLALPFRQARLWILPGWGAIFGLLLLREIGPVISVLTFQPSVRWLRVMPVAPVMAVMTWAACCIASVTRNQAAVQFKGPRNLKRQLSS